MKEISNLAADFHPPSINDFYPKQVLFANTWFAIDRIMLIRLVTTLILCLVFIAAFRKTKVIPGPLQSLGEYSIDFVRINIAEEILGKKAAPRFLPILVTTFFLALFLNVTSVVPFMNISSNGLIGMPLVLALLAYVVFNYVGIKKYGFWKYLRSTIVLPDVPPWVHVILIPIEFISTFILKPFTLTVRLMANMISGHLMLVLFFSATHFFVYSGWSLKVFAPFTLLSGVLFTFFELLVILLQAYIFALLVAVYIDAALHADSH